MSSSPDPSALPSDPTQEATSSPETTSPFTPLRAPFRRRQVLICTNVRDSALNRPSCGAQGSIHLRESLKAAVKAAGKKGEVMVTATSCLGHCPAQGCTVGIHPEGEWFVSGTDPEAEAALLARILAP